MQQLQVLLLEDEQVEYKFTFSEERNLKKRRGKRKTGNDEFYGSWTNRDMDRKKNQS